MSNKTKKKQNHTSQKKPLRIMDADSSIAIQLSVRPPKKEKGIIVSDSDWDDVKASYQKLKNVNNAYYTWSGVCFSTSVTLLLSLVTIIFDKKESVFDYIPALIMSILFLVSIILGVFLVVKGKDKASTIESAIASFETVIHRIERKTSGYDNINYYIQDGEKV